MARQEDVVTQVTRPDGSAPPRSDNHDDWDGYFDSPYVCYHWRTGDCRAVKFDRLQHHRILLRPDPWAYYFADAGIRHHVTTGLPRIGEVDYDLCLGREGGSDFTERDRLLLQLLRPHFVQLHRAAHAARSDGLTPRQREVLVLVACGLTDLGATTEWLEESRLPVNAPSRTGQTPDRAGAARSA